MSTEGRRPRVVVVTQYFAPERNFMITDVARALMAQAEVSVITSQPNFPAGRIFPGFRWYGWGTRVEEGIPVTRVPTFPYRGLRIIARTAGYLTFGFFATFAALLNVRAPDVWVVHQTPLSTAWGVSLARWIRGGRVVHLVVDLWPESMLAAGLMREGWASRAVAWTRRWTNGLADRLVVTTAGMRRLFAAEGVPEARMLEVPVWTEVQHGLTAPGALPVAEGTPYILYAGTIGPSQALMPLIDAMALLQQRGIAVELRIAGRGEDRPRLEAAAAAAGLRSVKFLGLVEPGDVTKLVRGAVAQIVPLARHPRFADTVPSKLLGAIGTGVPILAGLEGEARALAVESGLGFPYASDDPVALAAAIEAALALSPEERDRRAERAWAFYETRLAPATALGRILSLIDALASGPPTGAS